MPQRPFTERQVEVRTRPSQDFLQLYRQCVDRIYRYVLSRVNDRAEAEDLTSLVFLEAFKVRWRLASIENLPAWLFTIARNKVVDVYRQQRGGPALDGLEHLPAPEDDPLALLITVEQQQTLAAALSALTAEQQEILRLRYAGELTYRQIGEVLGKSEAAVKMAVHRLLDQLQSEMEQQDE